MRVDVRDAVSNLRIIGVLLKFGLELLIKGARFDPDSRTNSIDKLRALCLERGVQGAMKDDMEIVKNSIDMLHRLEEIRRDLRSLHATRR